MFKTCYNGDIESLKNLIHNGYDINKKDLANDRTPLYYSVINDNEELVLFLLENDVDINCHTRTGITPLIMALYENKHGETALDIAIEEDKKKLKICCWKKELREEVP